MRGLEGEDRGRLAASTSAAEPCAPLIKKSYESFDKAWRALHRWAGQLQHLQGRERRTAWRSRRANALDAEAAANAGENSIELQ